jgi:hypothetical protein
MLGTLFILTVLVIIFAFVLTTIGDDVAHVWQAVNGHLDPEMRRLRNLHKQTRR